MVEALLGACAAVLVAATVILLLAHTGALNDITRRQR